MSVSSSVFSRPVLTFDIETAPDVEAGRLLLGLDGLSDEEVVHAMTLRRQSEAATDFQRHHLHRIVAISVALRRADRLDVWSLGSARSDEADLIDRFFKGVDEYEPVLVSWNGSGFDLPVLHYRALRHGIAARTYWDTGHFDRDRRWDNYISRYQFAHIDMMDVLAGYQPRAAAKLDEIAVMLGLPGKMGQSGASVTDQWLAGEIEAIRHYCETDVVNTWLIYLRFERMRGRLIDRQYEEEVALTRRYLAESQRPHLQAYEKAWHESGTH